MPAFLDSVGTDGTGGLSQDICGEKVVTLNTGSGNYMTAVAGSNPINDPLTFEFDQSLAVETDIKLNTISYTV